VIQADQQRTSSMTLIGPSSSILTYITVCSNPRADGKGLLRAGNGTQALVMPLNAATYAEELAIKAGKPSQPIYGKKGKQVRGWKGFYGSVHDIVSCCEPAVDIS